MSEQPNERIDDGAERRTDADGAPLADGSDVEPNRSRPPARWVQLAYDLEQHGDPDPDEHREVY